MGALIAVNGDVISFASGKNVSVLIQSKALAATFRDVIEGTKWAIQIRFPAGGPRYAVQEVGETSTVCLRAS
jgi:hypothetical protein